MCVGRSRRECGHAVVHRDRLANQPAVVVGSGEVVGRERPRFARLGGERLRERAKHADSVRVQRSPVVHEALRSRVHRLTEVAERDHGEVGEARPRRRGDDRAELADGGRAVSGVQQCFREGEAGRGIARNGQRPFEEDRLAGVVAQRCAGGGDGAVAALGQVRTQGWLFEEGSPLVGRARFGAERDIGVGPLSEEVERERS